MKVRQGRMTVNGFFTEYESQAKKKVYFVNYESQADLKIYFAEYESQAGWKNANRKHLMY